MFLTSGNRPILPQCRKEDVVLCGLCSRGVILNDDDDGNLTIYDDNCDDDDYYLLQRNFKSENTLSVQFSENLQLI